MATISLTATNIKDNYYSETHQTDTSALDQSVLDAAKLDRFFIEFDNARSSIGTDSILRTGTMNFTDTGGNATFAQITEYGGNQSDGHIESFTGDLWADALGASYGGFSAIDSVGRSYSFIGSSDPTLVAMTFDGNEATGDGVAVLGYWITFYDAGASDAPRYFFFPLADQAQKIAMLDLPDGSGNGGTTILTHTNDIADSDQMVDSTIVAYVDMMSGAAINPDGIVTGTAGADLIDGAYTGDPNGDLVDNNDGNPNSATGDGDSIVAGAGNDTVLSGLGNDTVDGGTGNDSIHGGVSDDVLTGGVGADTLMGGAGDDQLIGGGADQMSGGDGDDIFTLDANLSDVGIVTIVGGEANEDGYADPNAHSRGVLAMFWTSAVWRMSLSPMTKRTPLGMARHWKAARLAIPTPMV